MKLPIYNVEEKPYCDNRCCDGQCETCRKFARLLDEVAKELPSMRIGISILGENIGVQHEIAAEDGQR